MEAQSAWTRRARNSSQPHYARRAHARAPTRRVLAGDLIAKHARDGPYQVAEVYAARGEADAAFEWLDRARVERDTGLTGVKTDPSVRPVRGDPRWAAFLNRIGLGN